MMQIGGILFANDSGDGPSGKPPESVSSLYRENIPLYRISDLRHQ